MLQVLGMGIGLAAVDTDDTGNLKGIGIGTGVWSLIAPLIAMFLGAMLVGRLCGSRDRKIGAMHGSVMWALALIIGMWAMVSVVSSIAHGVARVGGAAIGATGSVVSSGVGAASRNGDGAMSALGIDTNDLLGPINQRLKENGKPPITANQLEATTRAVAQRGLHQGKLDRNVLVDEIAKNTSLSRADAEDLANQFEDKYQAMADKAGNAVDQVSEKAKDVALETADKTGKVLLFGGLMMLLSLGAAIGGGMLGVKMREREEASDRTVVPPMSGGL
ncbi:MAG TPA: hypothetical protein VMZ53_09935 [Kofleriaceae bacterium]|nr:hypothetical protein [Kofleriaceae bacterium]